MSPTSEKYKPMSDFRPEIPEPDLRSCLVWFIVMILVVGIIVTAAIIFRK